MGYRADLDAAVGRVDRLRREVERTNDDLSKEIRAWAGDGDKAMARRRARDRLGAGTEPRRSQEKLRAEGKSGSGEFSRGDSVPPNPNFGLMFFRFFLSNRPNSIKIGRILKSEPG
jgi:hypothetical protein